MEHVRDSIQASVTRDLTKGRSALIQAHMAFQRIPSSTTWNGFGGITPHPDRGDYVPTVVRSW